MGTPFKMKGMSFGNFGIGSPLHHDIIKKQKTKYDKEGNIIRQKTKYQKHPADHPAHKKIKDENAGTKNGETKVVGELD